MFKYERMPATNNYTLNLNSFIRDTNVYQYIYIYYIYYLYICMYLAMLDLSSSVFQNLFCCCNVISGIQNCKENTVKIILICMHVCTARFRLSGL